MLGTNTLTLAFESYVTEDGLLNGASLLRPIHGLVLDEIRDYTDRVHGFDDTAIIYSADDTIQSTLSK